MSNAQHGAAGVRIGEPPPVVSIVIPVYNEEEAIGDDLRLIKRTMDAQSLSYEIIVVDDGSTDRSLAVVREFGMARVLRHPYNRGTGAALMTGIRETRSEVIVQTDGDGTYPNQEIPCLLEALTQYDMVIGARRSEKGSLRLLRGPAKAFIRWLASYLTGVKIPDLNSGLRAFKRDEVMRFFPILPFGHSWVSTITMAYLSSGYTVGFVPVDYYPRKGKSKFHPVRDTYNYLTLVVRATMYFNPLKVFLPMAATLLSLGTVKFVRDLFTYESVFYVPGSTIVILLMGVQLAAIGVLADLIVRRSAPLGPITRRRDDESP